MQKGVLSYFMIQASIKMMLLVFVGSVGLLNKPCYITFTFSGRILVIMTFSEST